MELMRIAFAIFFTLAVHHLSAQPAIVFKNSEQSLIIGTKVSILKDKKGSLTLSEVLRSDDFTPSQQQIPNLGLSKATFWLKFKIVNLSDISHLKLDLKNPLINRVTLYTIHPDSQVTVQRQGNAFDIPKRKYQNLDFLFDVTIPVNEEMEFLLKVKSKDQILLPLILASESTIQRFNNKYARFIGIYIGIILAMLFYNLFIYLSIRDPAYIYYILYILFIGLTQIDVLGVPFKYLWPNSPWFEHLSIILFPALGGSFAIMFIRSFIHVKEYSPALDKFLLLVLAVYMTAILFRLLSFDNISYRIIDINGMAGSIYVLFVAVFLARKGIRPAKFFLIAWSIFLLGVILYTLRNFGILPYNDFTNFTMQAGTCIEVILLSFALADKINIYKKEKEESQAEALRISKENEHLVREQNILLEAKVAERTLEMQKANNSLNVALQNLKAAQSQLVEAEKMASLGQLTAGIAHEINNPINFVKSNVKPLQMDINDLRMIIRCYEEINDANLTEKLREIKELKAQIDLPYINDEIEMLIKGIENGANRTADIVQGLRVFSRLDESELKEADIQEGIESTLILIRSSIPSHINVVRNYGELPQIVCFPGKLNQVFMNLLTNAVQAIQAKPEQGEESIVIKTYRAGDMAHISISDTGTGIPREVKEKVFEPFFTTKKVGEGTGLGLSIVFSIIEKHKGRIEVLSEYGKGTEFIITLPIIQMPIS